MDSVMAAAKPAASRTVFEPPPAITPRMMPRMLTRPSWPPRITSRSQLPRRWASRCPLPALAAPSTVARGFRLVVKLCCVDHDLGQHAVGDQFEAGAVSEWPDMPNRAEMLEDRRRAVEIGGVTAGEDRRLTALDDGWRAHDCCIDDV